MLLRSMLEFAVPTNVENPRIRTYEEAKERLGYVSPAHQAWVQECSHQEVVRTLEQQNINCFTTESVENYKKASSQVTWLDSIGIAWLYSYFKGFSWLAILLVLLMASAIFGMFMDKLTTHGNFFSHWLLGLAWVVLVVFVMNEILPSISWESCKLSKFPEDLPTDKLENALKVQQVLSKAELKVDYLKVNTTKIKEVLLYVEVDSVKVYIDA